MKSEISTLLIQPASAETLQVGIQRLLSAADSERAAIYEEQVFPIAAARFRTERDQFPSAELLLLPIGTQPYSPLLAALSTTTKKVAMLVTEPQVEEGVLRSPGSRPTAQRIIDALTQGLDGSDLPEIELFSIGTGTSGHAVVQAVDAALFWAGDPWPSDVAVDVSGGRKATTSALGGIASIAGFRQFYIEGRALAGGFYVDEERHALTDISTLMRYDDRKTATALLEAGAFADAAALLAGIDATQCSGPAVRWLLDLARALAQSESDLSAIVRSMPECSARDALTERVDANKARARLFIDALRRDGVWR